MKKILVFLFTFSFFIAGSKIYADFSSSDLISPKSGSVFKAGEIVDIKWNNKIEGYFYSSDSCVSCFNNIIVKHDNIIVNELRNIENDGEERIKIPNDTVIGKYQIFLYWNNYSNGPNNASGEKLVGTFYVISSQINNLIFISIIILIILGIFIFINKKSKKRDNN